MASMQFKNYPLLAGIFNNVIKISPSPPPVDQVNQQLESHASAVVPAHESQVMATQKQHTGKRKRALLPGLDPGSSHMAYRKSSEEGEDVDDSEIVIPAETLEQSDSDTEDGNGDSAAPATQPATRGQVYKDAEIWTYQQQLDYAWYSWAWSTYSDQDPTAQLEEPIKSSNEALNERAMEAVRYFWEPNWKYYGQMGWWGLDQVDAREGDAGEEDGLRPRKYYRTENAVAEGTEGSGSQELLQKTFTIDELLADVANLDTTDEWVVANEVVEVSSPKGKGKGRMNDTRLFGMEVPKDIVYDESELTPEEIEIQRWSINWRKQRAAEKQREEALALEAEQARELHEELMIAEEAHAKTYEFKSKVYPQLYGEGFDRIFELEEEVQRLFDASGGRGGDAGALTVIQRKVGKGRGRGTNNRTANNCLSSPHKNDFPVQSGSDVNATPRVLWPVIPIRI